MTAVPLLMTGGIHLDGVMATVAARSSYGDREKKLEILKDSHVGAFAVMGCGLYLLLTAGAWSALGWRGMKVMVGVFVMERALSGLAAVHFKGARTGGMLAAFREPAKKRPVTIVLLAILLMAAAAMFHFWPSAAVVCTMEALLLFAWYYKMAMKEFGGITGDLAGWFLSCCELLLLLTLAIMGLL